MKEVTKDEYRQFIGDKQIKYYVEGDYPYTSFWKDTYGNVVAKEVESYPEGGVYPTVSKYYIS